MRAFCLEMRTGFVTLGFHITTLLMLLKITRFIRVKQWRNINIKYPDGTTHAGTFIL